MRYTTSAHAYAAEFVSLTANAFLHSCLKLWKTAALASLAFAVSNGYSHDSVPHCVHVHLQ